MIRLDLIFYSQLYIVMVVVNQCKLRKIALYFFGVNHVPARWAQTKQVGAPTMPSSVIRESN
jgi:hypothetical protein